MLYMGGGGRSSGTNRASERRWAHVSAEARILLLAAAEGYLHRRRRPSRGGGLVWFKDLFAALMSFL